MGRRGWGSELQIILLPDKNTLCVCQCDSQRLQMVTRMWVFALWTGYHALLCTNISIHTKVSSHQTLNARIRAVH